MKSQAEETLALHIRGYGLPEPVREFRFHPVRRWRSDFAWPDDKLLVEVEGGIWTGGRHTRGSGYQKDMEKYNAATMLGYRILRFPPCAIKSGEAVEMIKEALDE